MYAEDIHLRPGKLSGKMFEMRLWLDQYCFEPSTFSCHDQSFGLLVSIKFRVAQEARAFAECFDGRTDRSSGALPGDLAERSRTGGFLRGRAKV
jgi:hypothetical protein